MTENTAKRNGFALPAVLAVTGVVTLIFLVAMTALTTLTSEARMARERVRFVQRAMTVEATFAYIAATEPIGPEGFNIGSPRNQDAFTSAVASQDQTGPVNLLKLDGTPYSLDLRGPMTISAQDHAGLVNLPRLDQSAFRRLMVQLGVPAASAPMIQARYQDYIDSDDLRTSNGAERRDYTDGEPANRRLLQPAEILSVLGLRKAVDKSRWRDLRDDLVSNEGELTSNLNTATANALAISFGLSPAQAAALITARHRAPLRSLLDYVLITGAPMPQPSELIYVFPNGLINVTIQDGLSPWSYRARMTLTPGDNAEPLWIDQIKVVEQRQAPTTPAANTSDSALAQNGSDTDENRFPYTFD